MSMWHFEMFRGSTGAPRELEIFMRQEALPYFRRRGFRVKFFVTQHEMGEGEFFFATEAPSFAHLDRWPEMAAGEPRGVQILTRLLNLIDGAPQASMLREIGEGDTPLRWEAHPMWHVERFNSTRPAGELEAHLVQRCLPYWRHRGFTAHVFQTELGLGPRTLWLLTGVDRFGSLDGWAEMALSEPHGQQTMTELESMLRDKVANLVRDCEA